MTFRWKGPCFVRASASLRERVRRDIAGRWGDKRGWPGADHPSAARAVVVVPGCEASPPGKIPGTGIRGTDGAISPRRAVACTPPPARSEEHTSELQSLMRISYSVYCLYKKTSHSH